MTDMIDAGDVLCSADKFDSWISDTNQRRSPEGGEDLSQMACAMPEPEQSFEAEKVNRINALRSIFVFCFSLTYFISIV